MCMQHVHANTDMQTTSKQPKTTLTTRVKTKLPVKDNVHVQLNSVIMHKIITQLPMPDLYINIQTYKAHTTFPVI